ncbi:MAG: tyramine oxidase subunit B [Alteraurantiacibacter sp.]
MQTVNARLQFTGGAGASKRGGYRSGQSRRNLLSVLVIGVDLVADLISPAGAADSALIGATLSGNDNAGERFGEALPRIDFLYLSEPDMIRAGVTDMARCVDTMEEMFRLLHLGDYRMAGGNNNSHGAIVVFPESSPFPEMPKPTTDRRFMAMPAYLGGSFRTAGMKWYGSNIANREKGLPRSILTFILNDVDTGAPLAMMSANLLSAYRTGAIPGVGARHLARRDSRVIGFVGPGVMARTSLAAFMAQCPQIDTVKIKGRGQANLDAFHNWVGATYPQLSVKAVETDEEVVRGSDIASFCASVATGDPSKYPLLKREWVNPGTFLSMPAPCSIDEGMIGPDIRKVLDFTGMYDAYLEELPAPRHNHVPSVGVRYFDLVEEGRLQRAELEDLGAIVSGTTPGRQNDDEIIILSVGGMAVEDVAWGTIIYRNAVANGIGCKLNLWEDPVLK